MEFGKLTVKLEWIHFTWDVTKAEAPYGTDTSGWNCVGEWCVFKPEECYYEFYNYYWTDIGSGDPQMLGTSLLP